MSHRKVNTAVLSASVTEHERQLRYHLGGPLSRFFAKLYHESLETARATDKPGLNDDLLIFQKQLKLLPQWNQKTIERVVDLILEWLRNRHFKIAQSIKTVVVGRTMLMVAMGNADGAVDDRVRVDIPDQYTFVHNVLSAAAHDLYGFPSLQRINPRDTDVDLRMKQEQVGNIIERAIENTILDQLSSPAVFAYLDQAMRGDILDGANEEDEVDAEDEPADSLGQGPLYAANAEDTFGDLSAAGLRAPGATVASAAPYARNLAEAPAYVDNTPATFAGVAPPAPPAKVAALDPISPPAVPQESVYALAPVVAVRDVDATFDK